MTAQDVYQDILLNLRSLPDEKIKEVQDFIEFLKSKEAFSVHDPFHVSQFAALQEDWEAPGMELYDEL